MTKIFTLLSLLFLCYFKSSAQTQAAVIKPPYSVLAAYDSKYGTTVNLPDNSMAMIVSMPNVDFAIVSLDSKLTQKWISPLAGFPLAVGKFKNNILVVAASERSWFKSFSGSYTAYLLDENTGKNVAEKVIYQGHPGFLEDPDFYFAKDGSYFKMTTRLTGMKRKTSLSGIDKTDKDYRLTQNFSIIEFDDMLNQRNKIEPKMPAGDTWNASCSAEGNFLISSMDRAAGKLNVATYISSSADPLKTISIPVAIRKSSEISSIQSTASTQPFVNYLAFTYLNPDKETTVFVARVDFKTGTFKVSNEVFDSKHTKELKKSFQPVNKKFDEPEFNKTDFLSVKHIAEYGGKLVVGVAPSYVQLSSYGSLIFDESLLLTVFDQELREVFHQFMPRAYMSVNGEGSKISYSLKGNLFRMIANHKSSSLGNTSSLYAELDFNTGQMLKLSKIPSEDISRGNYVNSESVSWLDNSFIIPYLERQRVLSTKLNMQIQLLNY